MAARLSMNKVVGAAQRRAFEGFFKAVAVATERSERQRRSIERCELVRDVPYHPDGAVAHLLDVTRPKDTAGPLPVLLYIHGGGFTICGKDTHRGIARAYAHHGKMAVFSINYRRAPKHRFPAAIEDACAAYAWVVENAARFGGDPSRIVLAGESAGGNLALALAICATQKRPEPWAAKAWEAGVAPLAVMPLCAIMQVSEPGRFKNGSGESPGLVLSWHQKMVRDVSAAYLGRSYRRPEPATALADPLLLVEEGLATERPFPEVFAMVGTKDILLSDTQRLEKALEKSRIPHEVHYYPGEGHAFQIQPWRPNAIRFWKDNLGFLHRRLSGT